MSKLNEKLKKENEITIRRRKSIYVPDTYGIGEPKLENSALIFSFMENISNLGFTITDKAIKVLLSIEEGILTEYLPLVVEEIKANIGADVVYTPMYPGFPKQVRDAEESELYINAIIHYISDGCLYPDYEGEYEVIDNVPLPYDELKKLDIIIDKKDLNKIFVNLITSKTSISESDKEDLSFYFANEYEVGTTFPEIPMKENIAIVTNLYINNSIQYSGDDLKNWYKTATDVLRLYAEMSDGDVSLASPTKFKNLSRRERKFFMDLLNNINYLEEDFNRYKEYWKRAGERIHPNSFSENKYSKVQIAFFKIRQGLKIKSWNSKVTELILDNDWEKAAIKLAERPGEFGRKLDYLLRNTDKPMQVVELFMHCAKDISTPVLLQIRNHFDNREDRNDYRVFFPKSKTAKAFIKDNSLVSIDKKYTRLITRFAENTIINRLSEKSCLGNVYVDESVKGFVAPFAQRNASKANRPCERGSRFKLKDSTKYIRTFVWWQNLEKDGREFRVDIDSSISIYDDNLNRCTEVTYYHLKDDKFQIFHSGDCVNGGPQSGLGASEFADVDIDSIVNNGGRYILFEAHVYGGVDSFSNENFPCRGGYMELKEMDTNAFNEKNHYNVWNNAGRDNDSIEKVANEVFDASRVEMKMDISVKGTFSIPIIVDCKTREVIWTDLTGSKNAITGINNSHTTKSTATAYLYSMLNTHKTTIYELIMLNVQARGILVDNKEEADTIFSLNEGITPFELDRFMSEFM